MKNRCFYYSFCLLLNLFYSSEVDAQNLPTVYISLDSSKLSEFRDTIYDFVFDSLNCQMVNMPQRVMRWTKKFKYLGNEKIRITRAWTGDPHYICHYPNQYLVKGKLYTFEVCFWFEGREGSFHKQMGFDLSNDKRISIIFYGAVAQKE